MKKKVIIVVSLIGVVTLISGICFHKNIKQSEITVDNQDNGLAIMLEKTVTSGQYEIDNGETWPSPSEYYFDRADCKNGSNVRWDSSTNSIILEGNKTDSCTLYFNKNKTFTLLSGYTIEGKEVSLTNILDTAGDFEKSGEWDSNCIITNEQKMYGTNSCKIAGDIIKPEVLSFSTATYNLDITHSYYVHINIFEPLNHSGYQIYWPSISGGVVLNVCQAYEINKWYDCSSVFSTRPGVATGKYAVRLDNNATYKDDEVYYDGLMIIDLTTDYSGKSIPNKTYLDQNLIYFDGKVDLKTVTGGKGEFKVTGVPTNAKYECNNNGTLTISNGIVTITGDSATTTCYLKKA